MKRYDAKTNCEKGVTILEVVVTVAIVSILAFAGQNLYSNSIKAAGEVFQENQKEGIRNIIRGRMDCAQTRARGFRYLHDARGQAIFTTSGRDMKMGDYTMRVGGYSAGSGVIGISVKHVTDATAKPLFSPVPLVCD